MRRSELRRLDHDEADGVRLTRTRSQLVVFVEDAILYSLPHMRISEFLRSLQVGDSPGHLEDAVKRPRTESQPIHSRLQQLSGRP